MPVALYPLFDERHPQRCLRARSVQVHDSNCRACFGERPAKFRAEQPHSACDNGHLVLQIEFFQNCHVYLLASLDLWRRVHLWICRINFIAVRFVREIQAFGECM